MVVKILGGVTTAEEGHTKDESIKVFLNGTISVSFIKSKPFNRFLTSRGASRGSARGRSLPIFWGGF